LADNGQMVKRSNKKKVMRKKLRSDLDAILRRVDRLPDLDPRTPDEIIGYDDNGIPSTSTTPSRSVPSALNAGGATDDPDIEGWRNTFGRDIPPAIKEFLEYRHREWELGLEADLEADSKTRPARTRKPAR
jgi:hypothetical protein